MVQHSSQSQLTFSVKEENGQYALCANNKLMQTPGKHPFLVPTQPLAEAVCNEWQGRQKFDKQSMPLTSLAYTAIDLIAGQENRTIDALLVYVDTDALSYREEGGNHLLAERQKEHWDPVLDWAGQRLGTPFAVTSGIMPIDQSPEVHQAFRKELERLDMMRLTLLTVLASCCSSMVLALAVIHGQLDGQQAFMLSRLEEETQNDRWGRDPEAEARAERIKNEILAATQFLHLLESR